MSDYHKPVMLAEAVGILDIKTGGVYVDLTFGAGGHSKEILKRIEHGHLYAFDQDLDAESNAKKIKERSFTFIRANFKHLTRYLRSFGVEQVDGIFGDLGISSHQIDEPSRGFSTRNEGRLDMRMNRDSPYSAEDLVNSMGETELKKLLSNYGEIKTAGKVARAICVSRANKPIETTSDLVKILEKLAPYRKQNKFYAQVFQAIRIGVNAEMEVLQDVLEQSARVLKPGGIVAILTYHSLEDRMVKNFFAKGKVIGDEEKDLYGNVMRPLRPLTKKPVTASLEEIGNNNRARSAKLRAAIKI